MEFLLKYIMSFIFISFGGGILVLIYAPLKKKNYNSVVAKIKSNSKYESSSVSQGRGMTYGVSLEYEYQIHGKKYLSNRIFKNSDSFSSSDSEWANQFSKKYPEGKSISIFVRKSYPKDTYIIEKSPGTLLFSFLATLLIIGGFLLWYFN